ncbi:MAG: DUF4440 domain-containing protein [bacterium]|nr:DUF4440 domain-containing protein [bacterium]
MTCQHTIRQAALFVLAALLATESAASDRQDALAAFQRETLGVTYRLGFCTPSEMDCSCFILRLFAGKFGRSLPRGTFYQVKALSSARVHSIQRPAQLTEQNLCVGDLIYTYRKGGWEDGSRHVVVYAGRDQVLHSSSSLGGVGASDLGWLRRNRLKGVYRPLGCEGEPARKPDVARLAPGAASPEATAPVRDVVDKLFRSWETKSLALYASCWRWDAVQWHHRRKRDYHEILRRRRELFRKLVSARQSHSFKAVTVWGDRALVEVTYSLHLTLHDGSRHEKKRESYILHRADGVWRITSNETYKGQ